MPLIRAPSSHPLPELPHVCYPSPGTYLAPEQSMDGGLETIDRTRIGWCEGDEQLERERIRRGVGDHVCNLIGLLSKPVDDGQQLRNEETTLGSLGGTFGKTVDRRNLRPVRLEGRTLDSENAWFVSSLIGIGIGWDGLSLDAHEVGLRNFLRIDTAEYCIEYIPVSIYTSTVVIVATLAYRQSSTVATHEVEADQERDESDRSSTSGKRFGNLLYYRLTMYYYALSLSHAQFLMVNSSWTRSHIASIISHEHFGPVIRWMHRATPLLFIKLFLSGSVVRLVMYGVDGPGSGIGYKTDKVKPVTVYPPCDTREMTRFSLQGRERIILSVAQFRPEKNLSMQLHAFAQLLMDHPEYKSLGIVSSEDPVRLVLLGGARHQDDLDRVESLRALARELDVQNQVSFVVNAPYSDMLGWLSRSSIGISTMIDEHFGINVVEFMAAGLIPVTHASGGPLNDIAVPYKSQPTGFHARTPGEFATAMHEILTMNAATDQGYRERARRWAVEKFSEEEFVKGWEGSGWRTCVRR
ncbi:mannosyltransferase, partial [Butyriboletus roseoflavus]